MRPLTYFLALLLVGLLAGTANAQSALTETRYCGAPKRDTNGVIIRRADVVYAYRKIHPCPSTGKLGMGACPDWAIDHVIPLACHGCDAVANLAWMPNAIKSGPGLLPKDRWERKIYCRPFQVVVFP